MAGLLEMVPHVVANLQCHLLVILLKMGLCKREECVSLLRILASVHDERQGIFACLQRLVKLSKVEVHGGDAAGDFGFHNLVVQILVEYQRFLGRSECLVKLLHLAVSVHQHVQGFRLRQLLPRLLVALHSPACHLRGFGNVASLNLRSENCSHRLDLHGGLQQLVDLKRVLGIFQSLLHILCLQVPLGDGKQFTGLGRLVFHFKVDVECLISTLQAILHFAV
mmetsp:Transcript_14966/g.22408  ORF Transcript_14966/g.22408 Transcript_14966/m.22408 type:complete len:223 (+) Transcript_14966:1235-1903(+)